MNAMIMTVVRSLVPIGLDEEREFLGFSEDWSVALDQIGARGADVGRVLVHVVHPVEPGQLAISFDRDRPVLAIGIDGDRPVVIVAIYEARR